MNRRHFIMTTLALATASRPLHAAPTRIEVYKSPTCGCCSAWIEHIARAGFAVDSRDVDQDTLHSLKARSGIAPELASCHTAIVDGYVIEGHVPASDVERLLAERPDALGLTVPGMPIGSPGMEMGEEREAFDTLLILRDGTSEVFARHT
ncbi:DUF411 domain-containing protein [Sedimentitalea sp. JM2-8]|uniref:DUF411 domain-containing protein n=1 Tax=Sedimentitalea xiamensis TaxID=3050037 RepID=A0ABT7FFP7_9RHOB|nr:DUF411 domain-containing protein [Sedimentitalea xiamensis]MDK3073820.1 DUF411 domain-containing protein [Sedimentitalea xiamensis]